MNSKYCVSLLAFFVVFGICNGSTDCSKRIEIETCQGKSYCSDYYCCDFKADEEAFYMKPQCFQATCFEKITTQIEEEFHAAFSYMILGAHFAEASQNHNGLADFFYGSASEERHHAIMMLDYLTSRGFQFNKGYSFNFDDLKEHVPKREDTEKHAIGYKQSLEKALKMEVKVTELIQKVLETCDQDLHAQDWFTDPIMAEQNDGMRKIQGAIRHLNNMQTLANDNSEIAFTEYLFDQKLVSGEIFG